MENNRKNPLIFVDMDEVLVDFIGGMLKLRELRLEDIDWEPGVWNMATVLGISHNEFWEPINEAGMDFWYDLEPLPWSWDLINLIQRITDNWYVVSSPSRSSLSYSGKHLWMKKHFPKFADRLVLTQHKAHILDTSGILIDDNEDTCKAFEKRGGKSVVFPTRGNSYYQHKEHPVDFVFGGLLGLGCDTKPLPVC